jgi:hypothetical protein
MRTFADLCASEDLLRADDSELGPVYWAPRGERPGGRIRVFDRPADRATYIAMHEHAHLWIHRDYEHDAWWVIDVDEPAEVGSDFVIMPRRVGNTLESFTSTDDPAQPLERLVELRTLMPELIAAARDPADHLIARIVAGRVAQPDANTIYVWADQRFYIQDLAPSSEELRAWRALPHHG